MLTKSFQIIRSAYNLFSAQRASRLAAALAFYALISLSPLLIVAVGAIDIFFDDEDMREQLIEITEAELPKSVADTIVPIIDGAGESRGGGLAAVFGVLVTILGASNVFNQLQDILNRLWDIDRPKKPLLQTIRERALAFAMVFGFGFLLIVVMIAQAALAALINTLPDIFLQFNWVPLASTLLSILLMALLFALIFRVLPDTEVGWRDALLGGAVTALLFRVGLWGITLYIRQSSAGAAYGVAGSLLVTLLIIYYTSMIFLFGAAVTRNISLTDTS